MIAFIRRLFHRQPTMAEKAARQAGKNIWLHVEQTTRIRRLG